MKYLIVLSLIYTTGCSTLKESVFTGAAIGGVAGGAIGNGQGRGKHRNVTTRNGLLIGAVLGGTIAYLAHKNKKIKVKTNKTPNVKLSKKKVEENYPKLTRPKVKKVWIKDKVIGNRFIKGHWEFIIEENSQWNN